MNEPEQTIRALATQAKPFFRLKLQLADGSVRVFSYGGGYYKVGESAPPRPGRGRTFFSYDRAATHWSSPSSASSIQSQAEVFRGAQAQLPPFNFSLSGSPAASAAAATTAPTATVFIAPPRPRHVRRQAEQKPLPRRRRSWSSASTCMRWTWRSASREFIRTSTYIRGVGRCSSSIASCAATHDGDAAHHGDARAQAFRDIEQVKTTIQSLLDLEIKVVSHAESRMSRPAAPPPTMWGSGTRHQPAREVSVALIQRGQPEQPSIPLAAPPQRRLRPVPPGIPSRLPGRHKPPSSVLERIDKEASDAHGDWSWRRP